MFENIGFTDRIVRALIGLVLLLIPFLSSESWSWTAIPGLGLLITAASGYCPTYRLCGIDTCHHK